MRISDWSSDVCSSDLIQQTLVDRSGKPCRIHDRHLRNEPAAAHCGHPLVPDRPSWLWNERTCRHECQRDKPVSRRGAKILRDHPPDRSATKLTTFQREVIHYIKNADTTKERP